MSQMKLFKLWQTIVFFIIYYTANMVVLLNKNEKMFFQDMFRIESAG